MESKRNTSLDDISMYKFDEDLKSYQSCSTLNEENMSLHNINVNVTDKKLLKHNMSTAINFPTGSIVTSISNNRRKLNKEKIMKNICYVENIFHKNINCRGRKVNIWFIFLGFFFTSFGILFQSIDFDIREITSSWENVEGYLPLYVVCPIMVFCGFLTIGAGGYPNKYLISVVLVVSLTCTSFCIASLIHLIGEVHANLRRLQNCWFNPVDKSCTCYVKSETHYKPVRFAKVDACSVVKDELKTLVVGVTVLFGIGFVISIIAAFTAIILLYRKFKQSSETRREVQHRTSVYSQTEESEFNHTSTVFHANSLQSVNSEEKECCMMSDASSDDYQRASLTDSSEDLPGYPPPTYQESVERKLLNENV